MILPHGRYRIYSLYVKGSIVWSERKAASAKVVDLWNSAAMIQSRNKLRLYTVTGTTAYGQHNEMPDRLRSLLYRTIHFIANPRHAEWQAGRDALRTINRRQPLPPLRQHSATGSVRQPAAERRDV